MSSLVRRLAVQATVAASLATPAMSHAPETEALLDLPAWETRWRLEPANPVLKAGDLPTSSGEA